MQLLSWPLGGYLLGRRATATLPCSACKWLMKAESRQTRRLDFRAFMIAHQYKVLFVSVVIGMIWVGPYYLLEDSWFLSRLTLLLAIISFVPAGLVVLIHGREAGPFLWWDRSNTVLTTRRSPKVEKIELVVMTVLWTIIFLFVVLVIFLARP